MWLSCIVSLHLPFCRRVNCKDVILSEKGDITDHPRQKPRPSKTSLSLRYPYLHSAVSVNGITIQAAQKYLPDTVEGGISAVEMSPGILFVGVALCLC